MMKLPIGTLRAEATEVVKLVDELAESMEQGKERIAAAAAIELIAKVRNRPILAPIAEKRVDELIRKDGIGDKTWATLLNHSARLNECARTTMIERVEVPKLMTALKTRERAVAARLIPARVTQ